MKYCPYCGSGLKENMVFCPKCGKAFEDVVESPNMHNMISEETAEIIGQNSNMQESATAESVVDNAEHKMEVVVEENRIKDLQKGRNKNRLWVLGLIVFAVVAIMAVSWIFSQQKEKSTNYEITTELDISVGNVLTSNSQEMTSNEIAKLTKAVLTLYVYDKNGDLLSSGSGFVAFDDKTIVTNYHVIDKGYSVEAFSEDGNCYNVDCVSYYDKDLDIAILYFEKGTGIEPLSIEDSSTVKVGDTVYAIGSPLGLSNTLSNGLVSAIREEDGHTDIQITAPISSGSSGGALFNAYGKVVGITYASYSGGQNLNLAVPSNEFAHIEKKEAKELAEVALFERPLGNTVENYSGRADVVQYGSLIFESCNSKEEIYYYNCETGERKSTGFYGSCLSVYKDVLFFISPSNEAICSLNIVTNEFNSNILADYPKEAHVKEIIRVFVSDCGITVLYESSFLTASLLQLGFDCSIVGFVDSLSTFTTLADEGLVVSPDYENFELDFVQLHNCEIVSVSLDFAPFSCIASEGSLYFEDDTYLIRYEIYTGLVEKIYMPYNCKSCAGVFNGNIYFSATNGTQKMSISDKSVNTITKMYSFTSVAFSEDGYMYAFGRTITGKENECYVRMSIDGSFVQELCFKELSGKIATFDEWVDYFSKNTKN